MGTLKVFFVIFLLIFYTPFTRAESTYPAEKEKTRLNIDRIYGGFGLSEHDSQIGNAKGEATGFSMFLGYLLPFQPTDYTRISFEAGYLSTENFSWDSGVGELSSADSILTSGILELNLIGNWQVLGRVGYDFGDDEGNFFGLGLGYLFNNGLNIRTEYMEQDKIDILQLNITMRVKDLFY